MGTVSVSAGGSGPLLAYTLRPLGMPNSSIIAHEIAGFVGTAKVITSCARTGLSGLLSADTTGAHQWLGACKYSNGLWSEYSAPQTLAFSNFTPGSIEGSIGSGSASANSLQSPNMLFPDLSMGSGRITTRRVVISSGPFQAEVRGELYRRGRATFHCTIQSLDTNQSQMLHRFFSCLGGPNRPFYFDWVPPETGSLQTGNAIRYLVCFRDIQVASKLIDSTVSEASFYLIEALGDDEEDS